jgi:regulator of replication initiation timing
MEQAQQNIKMATEMVAELERLRTENQALKKELAQFKPKKAMTKKPSMAPTTQAGWDRLNKFLEGGLIE